MSLATIPTVTSKRYWPVARVVVRDWLFVSTDNFRSGPTVTEIMRMVTEKTGVSRSALRSKRRVNGVSIARMVVCYLARELTSASFPTIGQMLDKDHSTVLQAARAVAARLPHDDELRAFVNDLKAELLFGGGE